MQTRTELTLEQTQQGVSDEVLSDTYVITMTMEILPEPTSNKLCGRSNAYARNPVNEILLNLNLPDHRCKLIGPSPWTIHGVSIYVKEYISPLHAMERLLVICPEIPFNQSRAGGSYRGSDKDPLDTQTQDVLKGMITSTTSKNPVRRFSREVVKPLGRIELEVAFKNNGLVRRTTKEFTVEEGRTVNAESFKQRKKGKELEKTKEEGSIEEVMMKLAFPNQKVTIGGNISPEGKARLKSLLKRSFDLFAWQSSYMVSIPRRVIEHTLNANTLVQLACQKNKEDYRWTKDAKRAFQEMEKLIMDLPSLTTLNSKDSLYIYLATLNEAISVVILADMKMEKVSGALCLRQDFDATNAGKHLDLMPCGATTLTKHVVEVSCTNPGGGCGNLGGGRVTRGGGDGLEGPNGQLSIVDT
ncbi:hypothetical protein Tco_0337080 [Tanacetum coccineum]